MKVRWLLAGLGVMVGLALFVRQPTQAQVNRDEGRFEDKFLIVYKKSTRNSWAIERVRLQDFAGRQFLVGVGTDTGVAQKYYIGTPVWIAMDDVSSIEVLSSRSSVRDAFQPQPPIPIRE